MSKRAPKGTPTGTNLYVLRTKTENGTKEIPARVDAVDVEHLRRCLRAGLLEQTPAGTFRITEAGLAAIAGKGA